MRDAPRNPLGMTCAEFAEAHGPAVRGKHAAAVGLYQRLFRRGEADLGGVRAGLGPIGRVQREMGEEGETVKFTQLLASGPTSSIETESVLIPMIGSTGAPRYTLCLSSQVGCAMGCTFCETARMGLVRSLSSAEIVGQWFAATFLLGIRPRNIVFMGMGEPMDNLDEVIQAIAVLTDSRGAAHAMSRISVSTVGRLDGIARLAEQVRRPGWHRLHLAVSVNAGDDATRASIMPINRAMPMGDLRAALAAWPIYGGSKICIEYVLIPGVNDAAEDARRLAAWAHGLPACVNVIPYNPRRNSPWPAPDEARVVEFLEWLSAAGAYVKRRRTKGRTLMGACGQLGNEAIRRKGRG